MHRKDGKPKKPFNNKGELNGRSFLTSLDVVDIRTAHANGGTSYTQLAKKYRVSKTLIAMIIRGHVWKHVPSPTQPTA